MTRNNHPRHRRLRFVPGLEPGPAFTASELSFEEICERYIAHQRTRAADIQKAAAEGSGNQAAIPAKLPLPDDEPDEVHPRRRPGVR